MNRGGGPANLVAHLLARVRRPAALPSRSVQSKVDEMGTRLETFPHRRLQGRPEFKLRVGDFRVLYEFNAKLGRIYLHYVGHRREIYKRN